MIKAIILCVLVLVVVDADTIQVRFPLPPLVTSAPATTAAVTATSTHQRHWPKPNTATNKTTASDLQQQKPADATKNGMPPFSDHLLLNTKTDCPTNAATLQCSGHGTCLRQKKQWISSFAPESKGYVIQGRCSCNRNYIGTACETDISTLPQNYVDRLVLHGFVEKRKSGYQQTTKGREGVPVHSLFGERHYTTDNNPNKSLIDPDVRRRRLSVSAGQPERAAALDKWAKPDLQAILPLSRMESEYHASLRHEGEAAIARAAANHVTHRRPNSTDRIGIYTNWKGKNILAPVLTADQDGIHVITSDDVDSLKPQSKLKDLLEAPPTALHSNTATPHTPKA